MKQLKDMKLGDELQKGMLGEFENLFEGKIRLMKITYTFQDKNAITADVKLEHKDYYYEEELSKPTEEKE